VVGHGDQQRVQHVSGVRLVEDLADPGGGVGAVGRADVHVRLSVVCVLHPFHLALRRDDLNEKAATAEAE